MKNAEHRYLFYRKKISKEKSIIKNCKICSGTGYIPIIPEHKSDFEYKDCSCKKEFLKTKEYILANFPRKRYSSPSKGFKKIFVRNMVTNKRIKLNSQIIKPYVAKYKEAKNHGLGLIFFGPSGTGKTTAALRILKSIIDKYHSNCYYIYFKDLIGLLLSTYEDHDKAPLFKEIISVDTLVIDELSLIGRVTDHMIAEFTSICKNRFENQQPTILISNYKSLDEVYHNFGAPMQSLINEAFASFKFLGKDIREEKFEYMRKFFE